MELSSRGLLLTVVVAANLFKCVCGILQIDNCINDKINITTDTNNPTDIKCSGLSTSYSVVWEVFYPLSVDKNTVPLATCSPGSCSNVRSGVMASGGSDFSILQIVQHHTQLLSGGRVRCNASPNEQPSCAVEIIAALPALTVTINGAEAELQVGSITTLRCRPGTTSIPETSLSYMWSGLTCDVSVTSPYICQFTAQAEHNMRVVTCVVTYKDHPNIPGKSATVTLHVASSTVSPTTKASESVTTPTPVIGPSTSTASGTTPPANAEGTTLPANGAEPQKANVGAIVGGVIGAVVVIAIVVVVVVFIIKRRKSRPKPPPASRRDDTEDHINPVYGTDDPSSPSSPTNTTTHNPPSSSNGIYSAVGGDEVPESNYVIPDSGLETPEAGYAAVDIRGRQPSTKPTAVVSAYEPVNEGKGAAKPPTHPKSYGGSSDYYSTVGGAAAGVNLMQPPPAMAASDEYAVVDKPKKSKKKGALHAQIPLDAEYAVVNKTMKTQSTAATAHPQDEYAVVDKSRKSQPAAAASGDEYAVVDKSRAKPAAKPKPGVKPKPTQSSATKPDDDQYNALNFQASQPSHDVEQNYSHLDDARSDADSQSSRL